MSDIVAVFAWTKRVADVTDAARRPNGKEW
jgi:hypothetical protein